MDIALFPIWIIIVVLCVIGCGIARMVRSGRGGWIALPVAVLVGVFVLYGFKARTVSQRGQYTKLENPRAYAVPRPPAYRSMNMATPATNPGQQWAENWEAFLNSQSVNGSQWTRAQNLVNSPSEDEARDQARTQAALFLLPRVSGGARANLIRVPGSKFVITDDWLISQIKDSLWRGVTIADEHVERVPRYYADLWSCQLLIDISPASLDRLTIALRESSRAEVADLGTTWGALAALFLVIVLLYAFLNAVTKGYFMWRLRSAALMIVIIALLVILRGV